jgi:preprotein translocase subunit SecD
MFLSLAASLALTSATHAAFKINENKSGSFGIFEVVDCGTSGARPKLLKTKEGAVLYCIAAKPIIDKRQLKWAAAGTNESGGAYLSLNLTKEGGRIMEAASQRLLGEKEAKKGEAQLAIVINGKLLTAPHLLGVIKDEFYVEGAFTQNELDKIADELNGKKGETHPAKSDGWEYNQ